MRPQEVVKGSSLRLLVASPECTHHSNARGGKPRSDQSRAQPWLVLDWLEKLYVRDVLLENVKEFLSWGPLDKNGHPLPSKKGTLFFAFINSLEALGYIVDWKILNSADYGAATSRERLFIQARKEDPIVWPEPTHAKDPQVHADKEFPLFVYQGSSRKKWRAAKEIIDWSIRGKSIFSRKKSLAPNTLLRIERGLEKFYGIPMEGHPLVHHFYPNWQPKPAQVKARKNGKTEKATPFIVTLNHGTDTNRSYPVTDPIPTLTSWDSWGFVVPHPHSNNDTPRSVDEPLFTVTAQSSDFGVVEPFITEHRGTASARSTEEPLSTVTGGGNHHGLVEGFVLPPEGIYRGNAPRSPEEPLQTITSRGGGQLVEPFVLGQQSGAAPRQVDEPLPTVSGAGAISLTEAVVITAGGPEGQGRNPHSINEPLGVVMPEDRKALAFLNVYHGASTPGNDRVASIEEPLGTVDTSNRYGVVEAYVTKYYGTGGANAVTEPLDTITAKDRFGLVLVSRDGKRQIVDILFRMIQPKELAGAMGFKPTYKFYGRRRDVVKQIGNAVEVHMAKALIGSLI